MNAVKVRPATRADYDFLYRLHKATLQEYVAQTWGWDERWQQAHFKRKFDPTRHQIIVFDDKDIGVISIVPKEDEVFLAIIEILPAYQGQGLGTILLNGILAEAFGKGLPVTLRVLKVNPARRLYERLGFIVTGETQSHYLMRAVPD